MAATGSPGGYRFGDFELELNTRRLLKEGEPVSLRPRAFDVLVALVDRAGEVVTKDELLTRVWPKVVVEEGSLHVQIFTLRRVLGAEAIVTVSGRGYQFTLPIEQQYRVTTRPRAPKTNLPHQLTSFIGREHEVAQLRELLATNRLVTLTGAGGSGKTRLAIEVVSRMVDVFPDGVWLVDLSALTDPRLVPPAVAQALGVKELSARPLIETLGDYFASKKLLLMLDNAEHLLEACVQLVDLALRRGPDVAMLVTSRERLGMTGELTYRVPSLTVPAVSETSSPSAVSQYEAVRLFVERAKLVRPNFKVTERNAAAIASICARLDGMPLAIELAAPRLRFISVDELSKELDQRFAFLTDGSRSALPRHRTLRSTIDWSYDLLTDTERTMLRRIAVFAGGWTMAAAEHVCAGDGIEKHDVLRVLTSLADKNLVIAEEQDGVTRCRLLETIRQYALDRLRDSGQEATWRNRHFAWVLALSDEAYAPMRGPQQAIWLDRLAREVDNYRAALQWAIEQKRASAFRLAPGLGRWWTRRASLREARQWFTRLLDAIPSDPGLPAKEGWDRARALGAVGNIAMRQADFEEAVCMFREADELFRRAGDNAGTAHVQTALANSLLGRGRYAEAQPLLTANIEAARSVGEPDLVAVNMGNLAIAVFKLGDVGRAAALMEEALSLARPLGKSILVSELLDYKGFMELRRGDLGSAEASIRESAMVVRDLKDAPATVHALERLAELAVAKGAPAQAALAWGTAARQREELGIPKPFHEVDDQERAVAVARAALGDGEFDHAWRKGREIDLEDAMRHIIAGIER